MRVTYSVGVSVLMTVYNGERTIAGALDALVSQEFRSATAFEVVVVNDGSTDNTANILMRYERSYPNVRIIHVGRVGRARALNIGLKECRAPYIAINDADDVSERHRLMHQYEYLEQNPNVVLVSGWARVVGDDGELLEERRLVNDDGYLRRRLALGNPFIHSTIMYRKAALERSGGFDEGRQAAIDYDAIERLARFGRIGVVPHFVVTHYRGKNQFFRSQLKPSIRLRSAADVAVRAAVHHAKVLLPISLFVYAMSRTPYSEYVWRRVSPVYSKLLTK